METGTSAEGLIGHSAQGVSFVLRIFFLQWGKHKYYEYNEK